MSRLGVYGLTQDLPDDRGVIYDQHLDLRAGGRYGMAPLRLTTQTVMVTALGREFADEKSSAPTNGGNIHGLRVR
jgi:hypothetical protein